MICRYPVECPECSAIIILRVSVGLDIEQPFYFVCDRCGGATRAKQVIWYEPSPGARLELEEGRQVPEPEKTEQVITVHPDLPAFSDAKYIADTDGSPFLMNHRLLGDRFEEFYSRLKEFRGLSGNDWKNLRRLIAHYLSRKWPEFDKMGEQILGKKWETPANDSQRHDLAHNLLDHLTAPLWISDHYPSMKLSWYESWSIGRSVPPDTKKTILKYMHTEEARGEIAVLQRQVFHVLELFMNSRTSWLPALPAAMYCQQANRSLDELRVFRADFPILRDLFLATFETCHRALKYVLAPGNAVRRCKVDDFGDNCASFKSFDRLPSARKAEFLKNLSAWESRWSTIFNRKLRNAIGHNDVFHDLSSGMIVVKRKEEIPYIEFLVGVLNLIHGILAVAHVLKFYGIAGSSNQT